MASFITKLNQTRLIIGNFKKCPLTSLSSRHVSNSPSIDITLLESTKTDPNVPKFDMPNPFEKEKPKCILCRLNITPNYKNVKLLSQFQSPYTGRIYGRHITGLCTHKQKQVELEIEKAQSACLMGYYNKDAEFMKDPKLFDPETPIRPHRF